MSTTATGFRVIANRHRESDRVKGGWEDLPNHRERIQHGDNGEAVREFVGEPINDTQKGASVLKCDLYDWLHAIHAYEDKR